MLTCREATALMSQEQDRALFWSERLALRLHVFICASCARFRAQMWILSDASARFRARLTDPDVTVGPKPGN